MQVKSFEGINMKDALQAVKNEFGSDAVILSTTEKTLENSNIKIVEVRAAAPEIKRYSATKNTKTIDTSPQIFSLEKKIELLETKIKNLSENMISKTQFQNLEGGIQEIKMLTLEALKNKEGSIIEGLPNYLIPLESNLRFTGIGDTHIAKLMQFLLSLPEPNGMELKNYESIDDYYKAQAIKWMFKKIKISETLAKNIGSTSIHTFIGPTGAGKTLTLAKIANQLKKENNSKVLVICYDNNRIAASEQLRIFAKVINLEFVSMSEASELSNIVLKNREMDFILIDTSGRCPKIESEIQDLKDLTQYSMPIDFHLVLPVTEKEQQLDKTIRGFTDLGIDSLIFSKIDESWTFGEIFNLNQKWNIPLSYFTTGQEFPNDIEKASRERVVERIFGI